MPTTSVSLLVINLLFPGDLTLFYYMRYQLTCYVPFDNLIHRHYFFYIDYETIHEKLEESGGPHVYERAPIVPCRIHPDDDRTRIAVCVCLFTVRLTDTLRRRRRRRNRSVTTFQYYIGYSSHYIHTFIMHRGKK